MLGESALFVDEFVFTPNAAVTRRQLRIPTPGKRVTAILLTSLLVLLATGFLVLRPGDEAVAQTYRYAFEIGDTRSYDLKIAMKVTPSGLPDAEPFEGKMQGAMSLSVVDKLEDGSAVLELGMSGVTFEPAIGGPAVEDGTLRMNVSPDGRVSSVEGAGGLLGLASASLRSPVSSGSPTDAAGSQFLFPQFPSDKVKPGDTWTESSTMKFPFGDDSITMNAEGRHDGFEDTSYGEAAHVHHVVRAPLDLSFTLKEIGRSLGAAATSDLPASLAGGAMKVTGDMTMDTDSLVLPSTSDLISMKGTLTTALEMVLDGGPAGASPPLSLNATMDVSLLRIDAA